MTDRSGECFAGLARGHHARACVLALLVVLFLLVPLAHANPPDQTWIGGIYDDADYDDIVVAVGSAMGTIEEGRPVVGPVALLVLVLLTADAGVRPASACPPPAGRAPPA